MSTATTPIETATRTPSASIRVRAVLPVLGLAAIVGTLFVLQLPHFSPYMTDDAYISLRYSQRLLEGHGLTWNDLRPVEGYTNLLWVLLCAGLGALHVSLPLAAHILGISTSLLVLAAVALSVYRAYPAALRFYASLVACGALALSSPFVVWALGGLEQPLLACLLVWSAFLLLPWLEAQRPSTRTAMGIGLLLGLAAITRADAALFTAAFYAGSVAADGVSRKSLLSRARILPLPVLFVAGQLAFRRVYYHEWLPNTAYVKVAFTLHRVHTGLSYLYLAGRIDAVLLVMVLAGSFGLWRAGRRKPVVFVWIVALSWTAYVVVIGGDIFPAVRHFEPLIALFGFLLPGCAYLVIDRLDRFKPLQVCALLACTALVASSDTLAWVEHWELEGESLGLFLKQAFGGKQPLLSSDAAGVVPFYAHVPALDPLGLNDYHIAHEASRARGYGWLGHELGDGAYILDQKPDLLLFRDFTGEAGLLPADEQIVQDPRFPRFYQAVRFDTPEPHSIRALVYVRRIDGRLGIESTSDRVVIPAYMATVDAANSARLVDGQAALVIAPGHQARFANVSITSGDWKIALETDSPSGLVLSGLLNSEPVAECNLCLHAGGTAPIDITLSNRSGAPVVLRSVTLTHR